MALGVHRKKTKRLTRRSSGFVEKITRSFGLKWINRDVDNSPPLLSKDKVERVSQLMEAQHQEKEAPKRIQILETQLQGLGDDLDVVRAKTREAEHIGKHIRVLDHPSMLSDKISHLEIEEDPYATLLKDDDVPIEVEVPINDSDPPTA
ncbi:hypothetical protein BHM03_00024249 [Ensete ventricosum]|nr:hypothetical protein BHM03_00024249 [Ensete ventricosum]